ncbi:hypothetical protein [Saccharomonospora cyanea]|uniref:Lipoprotein n=1 Tax=Saccharomonospora cyanea NA-134 TaxID=882082 RepID=H5XHU9_9PSEU|nr:hypothetical protein [Saccharomonospora cyanea]EHR59555.1 hypothetical protein SaccyDRAFT_0627 [Saccharomonospora cyanea NA-134]
MKRLSRSAAVAAGLALLAACSSNDGPATLTEGVYHSMEFGEPAALGPVDGSEEQEGVVFTVAEPGQPPACNYGDANLRIRVDVTTGSDPYYVNQLEGLFLGDSFAVERDSGYVSPAQTNTSCGSGLLGTEFETNEKYTLDIDLDATFDSGALVLTSPRVPDSGWKWEF